jgi:hypothetical protein
MNAFEAVQLLKARQNLILKGLPPDLLSEYREIESAVRHIDWLIVQKGADAQIKPFPLLRRLVSQAEDEGHRPSRTPLAQRRMVLREYLSNNGPSSRSQILLHTRIPPGSLSLLLTQGEFERNPEGLWQLKEP